MSDLVLFFLLGRLVIWTIQNFGPLNKINFNLFQELLSCDFCLGVWVYFFLALVFRIELDVISIPVITEMVLAVSSSFLMHLIVIGWREKFGTTYAN